MSAIIVNREKIFDIEDIHCFLSLLKISLISWNLESYHVHARRIAGYLSIQCKLRHKVRVKNFSLYRNICRKFVDFLFLCANKAFNRIRGILGDRLARFVSYLLRRAAKQSLNHC